MRKIEEHGGEIAHRLLQICGQVFSYAVITQRATNNPAVSLRGALKPFTKNNHAFIKPNEFPDGDSDIDNGTVYETTTQLRGQWHECEWLIPCDGR